MKTKALYPIIAGFMLASMNSLLAFPSFDPMSDASYTAGSSVAGKTDQGGDTWIGVATTTTAGSAPKLESFTFAPVTGLPAPTGTVAAHVTKPSAAAGGPGIRMDISAGGITTGTVYASMFLKCTNIANLASSTTAVTGGGIFCAALTADSGTTTGQPAQTAARLVFRKSANYSTAIPVYNIGVAKNRGTNAASGNPAAVYSSADFGTNDLLFVVLAYTFNSPATNDDVVKLWINPSSSSFGQATEPATAIQAGTAAVCTAANQPSSGAVAAGVLDDADAAKVGSFTVWARSTTQPDDMLIDEVRLGTTWAFVTGAPEISTQPAATATAGAGDNLTNSVVARSGSTATGSELTYQWFKGATLLSNGSSGNGSTYSGATTASLTISTAATTDSDTYKCVVANTMGSVTSSSSVVTVTGADPVITTQPPAATALTVNGTLNLSVVASTSNGPLTYKWQKDGANVVTDGTRIFGSTTSSLTINNLTAADAGNYLCSVTNALTAGTNSTTCVVTVSDPIITTQPSNVTTNYGTTATFHVVGSGSGTLTYQWRKAGVNLSNGASGSGSTYGNSQTDTLTIANVSFADQSASYTVVVTGAGTATSNNKSLIVKDPIINTPPADASATVGGSANFSVVAVGSGPITYQWLHITATTTNNVGAGAATLTLASITAADAGSYRCNVSGADGAIYPSANAVLTVLTPVSISEGPASRELKVGDHAAFTVVAAGTPPFSYGWSKDGSPISGATDSILAFSSLATGDAGSYTVSVTNLSGTASASASAVLAVRAGLHHLSTTNLVVTRVGDGAEPLIVTNGNTIYIDQYGTNGTYVSSMMIPDTGSGALVVAGQDNTGGALGLGEACLSPSPDGTVLTLSGYNVARPYNSLSSISTDNASVAPRGVGLITGSGNYQLGMRVTNSLITGGYRAVLTDNTQTNFWLVGGNMGVRYFNTGSTGAGVVIATGGTGGNNRFIGTFNGDIFMASAATNGGVYNITGLPKTATAATQVITYPTMNLVNEFAVSSDGNTIYLATGGINNSTGNGIERWDKSGATWTSNAVFSTGVGARGLVVDWSGFSGGGATGTGAVVYFTTAETNDNKLVKLVDAGTPTITTLQSAGPNQIFRSVKFGPASIAPTITCPAPVSVQCDGDVPAADFAGGSSTVSCGTATVTQVGSDSVSGFNPKTITRTYQVTDGCGNTATCAQTITVQDTTPPVVTLNGASDVTVECHDAYVDPGAGASDACDATVASTSQSGTVNLNAVGDYTRTYSATDVAGNTGTATRAIHVVDTTAPVITLNGSSPDTACLNGGAYVDPGATANDACLGSLAPAAGGVVDTTTAGSYTLTYFATDGVNSSTATRVVTVGTCAPFITAQPVNLIVTTKGSATNSVTAGGTGPFGYQWYFIKNGTTTPKKMVKSSTIPAVTNATLIINNVAGPANNGSYYCVVTNTTLHLGAQSANGTLTVYDGPTVTIAPPSKTLLAGFNYTMVAKVTKGAVGQTLSYQWKKEGNPILGATTSTYSLVNIQNPPDAGVYSCTVSNNSPTSGTATFTLTVTQDTEVPKVVLLLKPTDMAAKHALTTNDVPLDATGTNHAPDVDFIGKAVDKGLIVSAWVSNSVNQAVFPATFVKKITDLTGTNTSAGKPAFFLSHVSLVDGTNIFWGLATDSDGNTTNTAKGTKVFFIANPQALTLAKSGTGNITSVTDTTTKNWGNPTNTAVLAAGHNYTIKATPIGHLVTFQKWTVSDSTGPLADQLANPLTFTMTPGRTNTAVFSNHP